MRGTIYRFSPGDFPRRGGRACTTPFFVCRCAPNGLGRNRIAIVVSAKKVKKASTRNLVKRTIYEGARTIPYAGVDLLFVVSKQESETPAHVLKVRLRESLSRAVAAACAGHIKG